MYENISKHDGVNYGQRMQELKKSTNNYSPVGAGSDSSVPHMPGGGKSKFPIMKIATVGLAVAAGIGCFLLLRHRRIKQEKQKLKRGNMTPKGGAKLAGAAKPGGAAKKKPMWMSGVLALVILAGVGGGVYGVMKLMKK